MDRHFSIAKSISCLTKAVRDFTEAWKDRECNRSHSRLVTLNDLIEMEKRMGLKVSELKTEVSGLRAQVTKIWGEQQTKYNALVEKYDKLALQLDNAELDEETTKEVADFKSDLHAFDDTIPDLESTAASKKK